MLKTLLRTSKETLSPRLQVGSCVSVKLNKEKKWNYIVVGIYIFWYDVADCPRMHTFYHPRQHMHISSLLAHGETQRHLCVVKKDAKEIDPRGRIVCG